MEKTVYLTGPISGISLEVSTTWRAYAKMALQDVGITALSPMRDRSHYTTTNAIVFDYCDLLRSTVCLANFVGATQVSIGSMFELAWCYHLRKPVVAIFGEDRWHCHPFVQTACNFVVPDLDTGLDIVKRLLLP